MKSKQKVSRMRSIDSVRRWKQQLVEFAWRRTPGMRSLDRVHAKVLRYLIGRYQYAPLIDQHPTSKSAVTLPSTTHPTWHPRTSEQIRPKLKAIHTANEPSYREFATMRKWQWWLWQS